MTNEQLTRATRLHEAFGIRVDVCDFGLVHISHEGTVIDLLKRIKASSIEGENTELQAIHEFATFACERIKKVRDSKRMAAELRFCSPALHREVEEYVFTNTGAGGAREIKKTKACAQHITISGPEAKAPAGRGATPER